MGTILTIAASGSEMSNSCVITREEDACKRGCNVQANCPAFSILNPEYTMSVSPYQTACGIVDIMSHMMERYFSPTEHVELTDRLMEAGLKTVIHNGEIVMGDLTNYDARAELMWAGAIAHNRLLDTGRATDWASHKLEHELSALYDIAHGAGLAIITPAWMKYVLSKGQAWKLKQFAERVFDVSLGFGTEEEIAAEGIRRMTAYFESIGMKTTLHEAGIGNENFHRMAQRAAAMAGGACGGYLRLSAEDCEKIYQLAE